MSVELKKSLTRAAMIFAGFLAALIVFNAPHAYCIFAFFTPDLGEASLKGLSIPIVFFLFVNYLVIALMGYALARPFFDGGPVKNVELKVFASFFIGYICLSGIVRLVSFVCPYFWIYGIVLAVELLVIIIACWGKEGWYSTNVEKCSPWIFWLKRLSVGLVLIVFFGAALCIQVRQGDFSWVGHGPHQYARFLDEWYDNHLLHFPLISRHYDELIVHYFLCMPTHGKVSTIITWWVTLGLNKTSELVFLWIVFRRFGLSQIYSTLGVLFLFLGTSSLCPWRYYLLFDSSNFLFFTVHSGRVVGIGMVIFWIVNFLREDVSSRPLSLLTVFLAGIGLTSLPETNALWVLALLPWLLPSKTQGPGLGAHWVYFSLALILLLYTLPFAPNSFIVLRAVAVGGVVLVAAWIFAVQIFKLEKISRGAVALILSISFGMIFMGNLFRDNAICQWTFHKLAPVIGTVENRELSEDLLSKDPLKIGDFRETGDYNEYCKGSVEFISYYGWILIMIALIPFLYRRLPEGGSTMDQKLYRIFTLIVILLPFLFLVMDFTNFGPRRAWLKSRFLEVPVYFIMFACFYYLGRAASKIERFFMGVVLLAYIITPFWATERGRQIIENGQSAITRGF